MGHNLVGVEDLIRVAVVENQPAAELAVAMLKLEGIRAVWRLPDMTTAVWGPRDLCVRSAG
jgi:hypothetical protein